MRFRSYSVLPGFAPTLGFSLLYLGILVLLPISALVLYSVVNLSSQEFWQVVTEPRVIASFKLSFVASLIAALHDWNDARVTRKALMKLSDRALDDIGLTRLDVARLR